MFESIFTVQGMTCGHCVASVSEAVEELGGVRKVDVTLETSRMVVASDSPVEVDELAEMLGELGFTLAR